MPFGILFLFSVNDLKGNRMGYFNTISGKLSALTICYSSQYSIYVFMTSLPNTYIWKHTGNLFSTNHKFINIYNYFCVEIGKPVKLLLIMVLTTVPI